PQEYFVYYKGKWCTAGGKDPLFGHVDGFQIDPKRIRSFFSLTNIPGSRRMIANFLQEVFLWK
ncbi:MAG: hypothetical protein UF383_00955, partial [Oscillospiraceae bacterium]|nr:hypothetical protein [Oscillospiraceae bacterium]